MADKDDEVVRTLRLPRSLDERIITRARAESRSINAQIKFMLEKAEQAAEKTP